MQIQIDIDKTNHVALTFLVFKFLYRVGIFASTGLPDISRLENTYFAIRLTLIASRIGFL